MKKKRRIIFRLIEIIIIIGVLLGIGLCFYLVSPVSSKNEKVLVTIEEKTNTREIINLLKKDGLIKSRKFTLLYVKLNNINNIQHGNFELNRNMGLKEIFKTLTRTPKQATKTLTFHEGKNMRGFIKTITENTKITENDIINTLNDKEYIKSLMDEYWFLTDDILNDNIYYSLEGYLYPDTYEIYEKSTIKDIFKKMLDQEEKVLDKYKTKIDESNMGIHKIITLASIAELEGKTTDDRKNIIGVFYNRLNTNLPLGSDVTTYYGAKVDMADRDLYQAEIDDPNAYNTRPISSAGKLPVGPICNPSSDAIDAAINYIKNDYFYFVADNTGKLYFSKTDAEHTSLIERLKNEGKWNVYGE